MENSDHPALDINSLLKQLTAEEKASLCSGKDLWNTKSIDRLGIPSICVSDGPHGLRKVTVSHGIFGSESAPATCFPTASAAGATWNRELIYEIGTALADECRALGVDILLAPGINMKRTPLCGRNFEYFSEDPYHTAECAIAYINGIQDRGVGTSLKHFACNNQEYLRFSIDAVLDERTLMELYLRAFEDVIKKTDPWTVMSSYNSVNNTLVSENRELLTRILREEWKYPGLVVSDWASIYNRVKALRAGCELEMPGRFFSGDREICKALESGELSMADVDKAVASLLHLVNRVCAGRKKSPSVSMNDIADKHHQLARRAAAEGIVLLKNENSILPINKEKVKKIAVIGWFAEKPVIQGGGSSHVNPVKTDVPLDAIKKLAGNDIDILYAPGYGENPTSGQETETDRIEAEKAAELARTADIAVIFAGLYAGTESEGIDRNGIGLPENHNRLIEKIASVNRNTIVLLSNGSAVTMPWHDKVKGIVETWLAGQACAGAIADVLFGIVNPSGKLAESFPLRLEDTPAFTNYPGDNGRVHYGEGLYIGYRYYEKKKISTLFPFGFGLSYTSFAYTDMKAASAGSKTEPGADVSLKIRNTGKVFGKEIVQVYVANRTAKADMPDKELKAFAKIGLEPGEEKEAVFKLGREAFSYYDTSVKAWRVESGDYEILAGSSSADIRCRASVKISSPDKKVPVFSRHSYIYEFLDDPAGKKHLEEWFTKKTSGAITAATFDQPAFAGHRGLPLSKFIVFMKEQVTEEEIDELAEKINRENL